MKLIFKIIVSSLAIFLAAWIMPGVEVSSFPNAIWIAIVLALLNAFLKPLLILLTIPITVFTFGIFLLFINAIIILITSRLIPGFVVQGFFVAFIFSVLLSLIQFVLELPAWKRE